MTCTMQKVEITRIYYRQERADKDYGACLLASFDVIGGDA